MTDAHRDRIAGCLLGGAIGDAWGGAYEGRTGPVELGDHPWRLSDDTQLTLATCEAIAETRSADPGQIAEKMRDWFRARRLTGLGASTLRALRDLDVGQHWALSGRPGERAAGNGAAMRVAPLAFVLNPDDAEGRASIREIAHITHRNDEAYAGALAMVLAIRAALVGNPLDLITLSQQLPDTDVRDRLLALGADDPALSIAESGARYGCSAYVVESVPFALYAAAKLGDSSFEAVLAQIIKAGGDTDTNASMAGQVMGARLGLLGLPNALVNRLPERTFILDRAQSLVDSLSGG